MMAEETRRMRMDVTVNYPDDRKYLTLELANLMREFADWIEQVGPMNIAAEGVIGLNTGSIRWRALP